MTKYDEVKRRFEKYGKVRALRLKSGFGFIGYEDPRSAKDAISAMQGKKIFGDHRLVVTTREAYDF